MAVPAEMPATSTSSRIALPGRLLRLASDERLVAQVRAGSQPAFEVVYDRHHRGILAFSRHMLGSVHEAEDAVQHVFMAAYRDLVATDKPVLLRPWLYAIARNRCLTVLRGRRELPTEDVEPPATVALGEQVQARQDLQDLLADVAGLPDDQRAALVLAEIGDLSHEEIGDVIGCRRDKVKALIFQARTSLSVSREARETSCVEVRQQLAVLSGGALRRSPLKRHLAICAGCSEWHATVRAQRRALAAALPVVPSALLKDNALAAAFSGAGAGAAGSGVAASGGAAVVAAGHGAFAAKALVVVAFAGGGTAGVVAVDRASPGSRTAVEQAVSAAAAPQSRATAPAPGGSPPAAVVPAAAGAGGQIQEVGVAFEVFDDAGTRSLALPHDSRASERARGVAPSDGSGAGDGVQPVVFADRTEPGGAADPAGTLAPAGTLPQAGTLPEAGTLVPAGTLAPAGVLPPAGTLAPGLPGRDERGRSESAPGRNGTAGVRGAERRAEAKERAAARREEREKPAKDRVKERPEPPVTPVKPDLPAARVAPVATATPAPVPTPAPVATPTPTAVPTLDPVATPTPAGTTADPLVRGRVKGGRDGSAVRGSA